VTSQWVLEASLQARGRFLAKEAGILAGLEVAEEVFRQVDPMVRWQPLLADGRQWRVARPWLGSKGSHFPPQRGARRPQLPATHVGHRHAGAALCGCRSRYPRHDPRYTQDRPGLRALDKLAVRLGGACNHRFGLFDMVLIKDNHIAAAGESRPP